MSTSITFNGSTYTIPAIADARWGTQVTNYLVAIASGALQKSGGAFTLTANVDFGSSAYGLLSSHFSSKTANIADAGALRLARADVINWRNTTNSANLSLGVDSSNRLTFNSVVIPTSLTAGYLIVGNASNVPTATAISGDITIDSSGVTYIGATKIENAMIKTAAAIAYSKMAALTASRAMVTDGNGVATVSATTATELGYVAGVTSAIQTQISSLTTVNADTKEPHGIVGSPTVTYQGARVIRIAHPYVYYFQGTKVTSTVSKDVTVDNTSGNYYIVFTDAAHTATATTSPNLSTQVPYAAIYWNATTGDYLFQNELHGVTMDAETHKYLHLTRGAAYQSGGTVGGYVLNSDALANIQVSIDQTYYNDEDIVLSPAPRAEGDNWDKWYKSGANGEWTKDTADTIPTFHAANVPKINTIPSTTWGLASVTNNWFFNSYIFATNSAESNNRFIVIPGQNQANTQAAAQAFTIANMSLGTLISSEILPMYQLTWQYKTGNTNNNARVTLVAVTDLRRTTTPGVAAGITTAHNALGGRSDANSHPAAAIGNTPSGNLAATDVQAALDELQTDVDTRATGTQLTTHAGLTTGTHGIAGTIVGTSDTQALTNKDIDGGTASNTSRVTLPKNTTANLSGLTRKEGTMLWDSTVKKLYADDGSNLKVVGGGLITEYKSTTFNAEAGKHYLCSIGSNYTATLPAGAAESVVMFTTFGNTSSAYRLTIDGNGSETITYCDVAYTDVTLLPVNGWAQLMWDATNSTWRVDDQATFVSGTFAGDLTITGGLVVDTTTLVVDKTNDRVGIGTANPGAKIDLLDGELYLSDSDVAHGMTSVVPTTTYGRIAPVSATAGGLALWGFSDAGDEWGALLNGTIGNNNPTDTTPAIVLRGDKKSATTAREALAATETVLQIRNYATELVTVLGSGNVGIGTVSPSAGSPLTVSSANSDASYGCVILKKTASGGNSNYWLGCAGTGGEEGGLWNNSSGDFTTYTVSDARLKENIKDAEYGLSEIQQLRPVTFDWKDGRASEVKGFIAQEVMTVLPSAVGCKDDIYHLSTSDFIPVMVKAIQELSSINEAMSNKLDTLSAKNDAQVATIGALEARLAALEIKEV